MSMSKKHFEGIAKVIFDAGMGDATREGLVLPLAKQLVDYSPTFQPQRFVIACGITWLTKDQIALRIGSCDRSGVCIASVHVSDCRSQMSWSEQEAAS